MNESLRVRVVAALKNAPDGLTFNALQVLTGAGSDALECTLRSLRRSCEVATDSGRWFTYKRAVKRPVADAEPPKRPLKNNGKGRPSAASLMGADEPIKPFSDVERKVELLRVVAIKMRDDAPYIARGLLEIVDDLRAMEGVR